MASFVLIHGAWHGGWAFDGIAPLLTGAGHSVIAPTLPGMGGSPEELAAATLEGWGAFAADLCCRAAPPVILCGHSRGGIVVSTAAEMMPDCIAATVYIAAQLVPSGKSRTEMREIFGPNPPFEDIIIAHPDGHSTTVDAERAPAIFAQLSPPEAARAAAGSLLAEPAAPRATPLRLTPERYGRVPRHYIECTEDRTILLSHQRIMQQLQPCASVATLHADHTPMLSAPRALADALLRIAEGVA